MKIIKHLDEYIEVYLASFFLLVFSTLTFVQVIMRRVFENSLIWSEEMSRYAFIWFVYMAASYAVKYQRHVKFTFFVNLMPEKLSSLVKFFAYLLWLAFLLFLNVYAVNQIFSLHASMQLSPTNQWPIYLVYLALPLGLTLMTIRVVQHTLLAIKDLKIKFNNNNSTEQPE